MINEPFLANAQAPNHILSPLSPTHDRSHWTGDSTERLLCHLLVRQDEANKQQEEWCRYVDQRQNENNQELLTMLSKLTRSDIKPTSLPTVVSPNTTVILCIGTNSSEKVRLSKGLYDYVPDDNLTQRHKGNVSNDINVDITQAADTLPYNQV